MNPYESAFDFGNISIDGDSTPCNKLPVQSPRNNISESEVIPAAFKPPPVAANLVASQSQLPPPRSMNELYKRRFRRPYITEEGYNLDDYRDEKVPLPKDPGYLATKKDILKHRDMIRDKFSTMQSANNITHMLYFEQPLDSKRTISATYPYDQKKKTHSMKKKEETKRLRSETRDITKYSLLFEKLENFGDTTFEQRESVLETTFTMDMSRYPFYKL